MISGSGQCCCSVGWKNDNIKQEEMFERLVKKETVRKAATIMVCHMGDSGGQSMISGSGGVCTGGPGIMINSTKLQAYQQTKLLAHEFGHMFGLHHVFRTHCKDE